LPKQQTLAGDALGQAVESVTYDRGNNLVHVVFRQEFGAGEIDIAVIRQGHQEKRGRLPRITRLMALAIRCEELLRSGVVPSYAELARRGIVTRPRITQMLNLLNLAPQIQEELLFLPEIRQGQDAITEQALRRLSTTNAWDAQIEAWKQLQRDAAVANPDGT
jgi:hypothetical protein